MSSVEAELDPRTGFYREQSISVDTIINTHHFQCIWPFFTKSNFPDAAVDSISQSRLENNVFGVEITLSE